MCQCIYAPVTQNKTSKKKINMTKEFYTKHKDIIEAAIKSAHVSYNMSASKSRKVALHYYEITTKKVSITVYAIKHPESRSVSKYIAKIKIAYDTKDKKQFIIAKDTTNFASSLYHKLSAKHEEQIARTQLKQNYHNRAFARKR